MLPSVVPPAVQPLVVDKNCGVLVTPASSRKSSVKRSVKRTDLASEASRLKKLGPLKVVAPNAAKRTGCGSRETCGAEPGSGISDSVQNFYRRHQVWRLRFSGAKSEVTLAARSKGSPDRMVTEAGDAPAAHNLRADSGSDPPLVFSKRQNRAQNFAGKFGCDRNRSVRNCAADCRPRMPGRCQSSVWKPTPGVSRGGRQAARETLVEFHRTILPPESRPHSPHVADSRRNRRIDA